MRKILPLMLCVGIVLSLVACGSNSPLPGSDTAVTTQSAQTEETIPTVEKWMAYEIEFTSEIIYSNPVYTYDMDVIFTHTESGKSFTQPAFWCGRKLWKVRVAFTETGVWSYETHFDDRGNAGLHGLTGKVECVPYTGDLAIYQHGFLKTERGTRYFLYDDGTPFFYLGDTHWTLALEQIDGIGDISAEVASEYGINSQFRYIMDYRAEQGYTVIQSQPLGWYEGATGNSWFGDSGGSVFDYGVTLALAEKFNEYDRYFAYIAEKGFVHANSQLGYPEELIETYLAGGITDQKLEKLCRYWVARYSAYPVMWTTTQEGDNDYYNYGGCTTENNPWLLVMEYVDKYDVYDHPATCHQENVQNTVVSGSVFGKLPAHDWYAAQYTPNLTDGYNAPFSVLKEYYNNEGAKPVVNYEGRYDHFWTGSLGARAQGWLAYLNGNFGYGYGVQPIWSISWAEYGEKTPTKDEAETYERDYNWVEGLYSETGAQLALMKDFLLDYEWYRLEPCFDGDEYYAPQGARNYSAAHIGNEVYIAYFYGTAQRGNGRFQNMRNGAYELIWFNCRTGETKTETVAVENGSFAIPAKPDRQDWAVALRYQG